MSTLAWEVRRRIAPIPIWRWTTWGVYVGRQTPDATPICRSLVAWARDRWSDEDELVSELELDTLHAWEQRGHVGVERAELIYNTPSLRALLEQSLIAGLDHEEIAQGMTAKMGAALTPAHIRCYQEIFFDTVNVPSVVIAQWQGARGLTWSAEYDSLLPDSLKKQWARTRLGLVAQVNGADALNFMLIRSIAVSAQMTSPLDAATAISWQDQAIKLMRAGKELGLFKDGKGRLPDHLVADVVTDWEHLNGLPPANVEIEFDDSYQEKKKP